MLPSCVFDMPASALFHGFLGCRHDDLSSLFAVLGKWQTYVVKVSLVTTLLNSLRLHAKARLLLILQHGLHKFAHDCSFLSLHLIYFFLCILVLLAHFVQFDPKIVTFLIVLCHLIMVLLLIVFSITLALS